MDEPAGRTGPLSTRRNVLLGVAVVAVVASAGVGWLVGSRIRSPAEIAADAEPPEPSNITVEVVRRELSADVITRGDIVYDEPVEVSLSGSFAEQPEQLVVTEAVAVDAELGEGDRAVEVVGRPVFVLQGEIPMYRDLRPGSSGDDVLQLEESMVRLGHLDGTADEVWDEQTGSAVTAWYEEQGYRAMGLSEEDEDGVRAARDRVRAAEGALNDARQAAADPGSGKAAVLSAKAEISAAEAALELAELDAAKAIDDAHRAADTAKAELDAAVGAHASAVTRLEKAQGGAHPDTGAAPTPGELEELRGKVAEAQAAVSSAETAVGDAEFGVARASSEQGALVEQAEDRVSIAEAALGDLQRGTDGSALQRQIELAEDELALATDELVELESELGTWLPAGEVVFLDRLPVRVDQVATSRGSVIEGAFITVSGSELALRAAVSESDATRVGEGMGVWVENPETGVDIPGTITVVADRAGTNGAPPDRVYVEVEPEEVPDELIGQNVKVTIPVSTTEGEVLAVPAAALSARADGTTIVQVDDGGELRSVEVVAGLAAEGLVSVEPVSGDLAEGDLVVVGREDGGDGQADGDGPGIDDADAEPAADDEARAAGTTEGS